MISVTKNMGDLRTEDVCGCAATLESQYAPLRNNVFVSFLYQPAGITRLWCCILLAYVCFTTCLLQFVV